MMISTRMVKFEKKMEGKRKNYLFNCIFSIISLRVHQNFKFWDLLDIEFNSTSNPYPHCILLRYPWYQKMKISIKNCILILKYVLLKFSFFGYHRYLRSMKCGYGLDSNESPKSKFGWFDKEICQKYDEEK